jgi:hypothetical protein
VRAAPLIRAGSINAHFTHGPEIRAVRGASLVEHRGNEQQVRKVNAYRTDVRLNATRIRTNRNNPVGCDYRDHRRVRDGDSDQAADTR